MLRRTTAVLFGLSVLLVAQPVTPESPKKGFQTGIAARVYRDVITVAEVWDALGVRALDLPEKEREQAFQTTLVGLVEGLLVDQAARRVGLSLNEEWIDGVVEFEKARLGGEVNFRQYILEQGLTELEFRERVAFKRKVEAFLRARSGLGAIGTILRSEHVIDPPLEEVRAAYRARRDKEFTQARRARVQAIALSVRTLEAEHGGREGALAFAEKMAEDLRTGADFALLANRHSMFERRKEEKEKTGGDFGWLGEDSSVNENIMRAALTADPEDLAAVGDVVTILDGSIFFIIQVVEREEARVLSFEEVAPRLTEFLKERRVRRALAEVKLEMASEAFVTPASVKQLLIMKLRAERNALGR